MPDCQGDKSSGKAHHWVRKIWSSHANVDDPTHSIYTAWGPSTTCHRESYASLGYNQILNRAVISCANHNLIKRLIRTWGYPFQMNDKWMASYKDMVWYTIPCVIFPYKPICLVYFTLSAECFTILHHIDHCLAISAFRFIICNPIWLSSPRGCRRGIVITIVCVSVVLSFCVSVCANYLDDILQTYRQIFMQVNKWYLKYWYKI